MSTTNDSWVLITGASSGFGEEFARQYAAKGHPLVLVARRLERLQALAESLRRERGIKVVVEQDGDLSDKGSLPKLTSCLHNGKLVLQVAP